MENKKAAKISVVLYRRESNLYLVTNLLKYWQFKIKMDNHVNTHNVIVYAWGTVFLAASSDFYILKEFTLFSE